MKEAKKPAKQELRKRRHTVQTLTSVSLHTRHNQAHGLIAIIR